MAQSTQERRQAQRRIAKKGSNPIKGMGAATRKVLSTRNGPKATETDHLRSDQFAGRHHAPTSYASAMKNAQGVESSGKHRMGASYQGKHTGPHDHFADVTAVIKNGGSSRGKHAKNSWFSR